MYTIETENGNATLNFSFFTCSMLAMDLSDRQQTRVDLVSEETGEIIAAWDCGIKVWDATA